MLDRYFFEGRGPHPWRVSDAVYRSEAATGHRNRAIGHLLLTVGAARSSTRAGPGSLLQAVLRASGLRRTWHAWARPSPTSGRTLPPAIRSSTSVAVRDTIVGHVHVWHVRLLRQLGPRRRHPGQERRRRRHRRRGEPPARHRNLLTAAGCEGQLRARARGVLANSRTSSDCTRSSARTTGPTTCDRSSAGGID